MAAVPRRCGIAKMPPCRPLLRPRPFLPRGVTVRRFTGCQPVADSGRPPAPTQRAGERASRYSRIAEAAQESGLSLDAFDPVIHPAGLGGVAEGPILAAIARGQLKGLAGEGQPRKEIGHDVTHFGRTPNAEILRTLAANGVKPESIERRTHCKHLLTDFRKALRKSMKARAAEGAAIDTAAMATVLSAQAARRPYARVVDELNEEIGLYNTAVTKDLLVYNTLPLVPARPVSLAKEVCAALAELRQADGG